ncbi:MAG: hypothetical protein L6R40_004202 [Gallowayella cf. fulva]|nr:MAG: hypothetical protein L6R40_004202 [Xanthomendoza cf. fulva]
MPRTLPWLKDQGVSQARSTRHPPPKRPRLLDPDSDSSDNARSLQRARARQRRELAQRAGRTPSTSPPPAPPPVEYMHEGLSHDDIYIMVEDEFLSTAQLFTSHLHHAEYVRLKNAARARTNNNNNNNNLQPATSSVLAHPTDSITAMRAETKKKKEAEARAGKNNTALQRMKEDARGGITVTSDAEDGLNSEDEADEAPWAGTSLQGLMAPAARKNLTSLSGLQAIQSSTRAAKGYAKPQDGQSQARQHNKHKLFNADAPRVQAHRTDPTREPSKRHPSTSPSESSNDDSDDLDALTTRRPPPPSKPYLPPTEKSKPADPLTLAASDLFQPTRKHRPPKRSSPPRKPLPNSSPPDRNAEVAAARRRLQERRERAAASAARQSLKEGGGGRDGNANVNEIPVFLI